LLLPTVRQYFPKNTDFSKTTFEEALATANKLNHHPRKCLDFMTPVEIFLLCLFHLQLESKITNKIP
jgi:IS30 family transposase